MAIRRHPAPKTISYSFGFRAGIDLDKLGRLADELKAEDSQKEFVILPDVNALIHAHNADRRRENWIRGLAGLN